MHRYKSPEASTVVLTTIIVLVGNYEPADGMLGKRDDVVVLYVRAVDHNQLPDRCMSLRPLLALDKVQERLARDLATPAQLKR